MDVFVSDGAKRSLLAELILHSGGGPDGLLLGHKRGSRFIVEEILPTRSGFFASQSALAACDRYLQHRILGFFTYSPGSGKIQKILTPIAYGKLYLEVAGDGIDNLVLISYLIEYKDGFFLAPIPIAN